MSELLRSFAKASLNKLPPEPSPEFDERDEQEDAIFQPTPDDGADSSSSSSSSSSTGTIVPSPSQNLFEGHLRSRSAKFGSEPSAWSEYFSQELFFDRHIDGVHIRHHAYLTPPTGSGPLLVTHHGAGSSGLSFATFTTAIQAALPDAGVLSIDARDHGDTTITSEGDEPVILDLSLGTLSDDLSFVVRSTIPKLSQSTPPPIILVGHSLGGAVITHVAYNQSTLLSHPLQVLGHVVLDVVEGSAIDALQSMESYLSTRPKAFPTVSSAIDWHVRTRTIRNRTSARVSVPSLLRPFRDPEGTQLYGWRTDLSSTKPFWHDWFLGLSAKFLGAPGGKLLVLAGTDRLDRELTIGQMQGKYELQILPEAGHFVHEDYPDKVAAVVAEFYHRNDRSTLVLPPKVDELIRLGKLKKGKEAK